MLIYLALFIFFEKSIYIVIPESIISRRDRQLAESRKKLTYPESFLIYKTNPLILEIPHR
ncbi:MAG: hypothetical protein UR66_C0008G0035 [Candidatus Moranbacteria bacterium GW2011_GWE1_35_17]|nr:MAG: hypothetical protein UR66_C0008G0035 [Candidatus Moranbacteria bacterium GW2011_GWE1_35_17]KKP72263.1 MAG: hypothetical protein UR65_C0018G0013 [Candidatus Moranbacteria bacterium GW2011_GWE2_35_164]KKP84278.1 MAG: hypothetical protein UR83_C0024G0007 [Candidatus Moranbacteria bacterium GW2011_GWF2_35_54]